jgi:hypothetical protein
VQVERANRECRMLSTAGGAGHLRSQTCERRRPSKMIFLTLGLTPTGRLSKRREMAQGQRAAGIRGPRSIFTIHAIFMSDVNKAQALNPCRRHLYRLSATYRRLSATPIAPFLSPKWRCNLL